MIERLLGLLSDVHCGGCRRVGSAFCADCRQLFRADLQPACFGCNVPSKRFATCQNCRSRTVLAAGWAAGSYQGVLATLIGRLKFDCERPVALSLAELLHHRAPRLGNVVVVPVPTANQRRRQRGFDHAVLIARQFAARRGLYYTDCLRRLTQTRQLGAVRLVRQHQMRDALALRRSADVRGKAIVLIDDVVTTGATLEAAAELLWQAGARVVVGLVVAKRL